MENNTAQLSPRDKAYRIMTFILAAAVAVCLIMVFSHVGGLHPVKNDAQIQTENYQETGTEYQEVSNMVEGFTVQR